MMKTTKLLSLIILSLIFTYFSTQFINTAEARMDYSNPARYEKQACYPLCGLQQYEKKVADANAQAQAQNQNTNANYNSNYNSADTQLGKNNPNNQMFTYYTGGNANYNGNNNQNPNYYTANNNNQNRYYQDPQRLSQSGPMSYIIFLIVIMGTYGIVFFIRRKRKQILSLAV